MKKKKKKLSLSNRIFYLFNSIFWIVIMFIILYPLYLVCIASVSGPDAIVRGEVIWHPVDFSLIGYEAVLGYAELWSSYANSIFYTAVSICISIVVTLAAAYALSRKVFPGKSAINLYFVITMFFNGGLIPTYLVVSKLGMLNSVWALILPGGVAVFNVIVARTFFESSIPEDLYEAAAIDGSSNLRTFVRIALPLAKPILAVMVIFTMVAYWNDWFTALIYMNEKSKYPLQLALRQVLIQSQATATMMGNMDGGYAEANKITELIKFASIVVGSVPMLIAYPFVQKYFEKGFMAGAVKG